MNHCKSLRNRLPLLTLAATLQCVPDAHWRSEETAQSVAGSGAILGGPGYPANGANAGHWNALLGGRASTDLAVAAGTGNQIGTLLSTGPSIDASAGANSTGGTRVTRLNDAGGGGVASTSTSSEGHSGRAGASGAGNATLGGTASKASGITGGNATGGNPTGGVATGVGSTNVAGSNATGGNATGGNATGGNATGGNATGGNATGGNATTSNCTGSAQFSASGAAVPFVVPSCATHIKVDAYGAEGGTAFNLSADNPVGGKGAYVSAVIAVTGGETLYAFVGGRGGDGSRYFGGDAGWNGGGLGGYADGGSWVGAAAGGGGATDLRRSGSTLDDRLIVAAGGGGASGACFSPTIPRPAGGDGGIREGGMGGICLTAIESIGYGGTQVKGGIGGNYNDCWSNPGEYGFGGDACQDAGGGGGGGYYGGGAGAWGGGGGGSSYTVASATNVVAIPGQHLGTGLLVISW